MFPLRGVLRDPLQRGTDARDTCAGRAGSRCSNVTPVVLHGDRSPGCANGCQLSQCGSVISALSVSAPTVSAFHACPGWCTGSTSLRSRCSVAKWAGSTLPAQIVPAIHFRNERVSELPSLSRVRGHPRRQAQPPARQADRATGSRASATDRGGDPVAAEARGRQVLLSSSLQIRRHQPFMEEAVRIYCIGGGAGNRKRVRTRQAHDIAARHDSTRRGAGLRVESCI
jgi:hypothetical protein